MSVRRVYVEKKPGFRVEATGLLKDLRDNLYLNTLEEVRILYRYDIDHISENVYKQAIGRILSEAPVDRVYIETMPEDAQGPDLFCRRIFARSVRSAGRFCRAVHSYIKGGKKTQRVACAKVYLLRGSAFRRRRE